MTQLKLVANNGETVKEAPKMDKPKTDTARVTFLWSENGFVPKEGLTVQGFKAAHEMLRRWAPHAPSYGGGRGCAYDKTAFRIEVEGLPNYEGRFDIQTPDYHDHEPYDLVLHMEAFHEWHAPMALKMAKAKVEAAKTADERELAEKNLYVEETELQANQAMIKCYRLMMQMEPELDMAALPTVPEPKPQPEPEPEPEPSREFRGEKFERELSVKDIAKRFRADIKAAKKAGKLPKELKLSVRMRHYTSIDACIVAVPSDWVVINPEWKKAYDANDSSGMYHSGSQYGPELTAAHEMLNEMLSAYRRDDSDSQRDYFDVNFYGRVDVSYDLRFVPEPEPAPEPAPEPEPVDESPTNPFKVDDILYSSWGYEQTNIDFYQVVKTTKKTIVIREIASKTTKDSELAMQGDKVPLPGQFEGGERRKRVQFYNGSAYVSISSYSSAELWDGEPKRCSWYA